VGPPPGGVERTHAHVFVDDLEAPELTGADREHLARVLRLRPGEPLTVSDGAGGWRLCRFGDPPQPDGPVRHDPSVAPSITVALAVVKGDRTEWAVQKLTEIGVDEIVPLHCDRSVVRWDHTRAARQHARLVRIAREAAMQSRRTRLPAVRALTSVGDVLTRAGAVLADPGGEVPSLERSVVAVGPEGGFTDEERAGAPATLGLGPTVLRTETAAVVAGTLLAALRARLVTPVTAQVP
jgi:16S rRNA (uracil1498-N3)-methyltransferase